MGRLLVVYLLPADDMAWAVVASRKVGGAVQRNRAKRLLREARRAGALARPESVMGLRARFFPDLDAANVNADPVGSEGLWVVWWPAATSSIRRAAKCAPNWTSC